MKKKKEGAEAKNPIPCFLCLPSLYVWFLENLRENTRKKNGGKAEEKKNEGKKLRENIKENIIA